MHFFSVSNQDIPVLHLNNIQNTVSQQSQHSQSAWSASQDSQSAQTALSGSTVRQQSQSAQSVSQYALAFRTFALVIASIDQFDLVLLMDLMCIYVSVIEECHNTNSKSLDREKCLDMNLTLITRIWDQWP